MCKIGIMSDKKRYSCGYMSQNEENIILWWYLNINENNELSCYEWCLMIL